MGHQRPILELNYSDPLFQMRFHPTKPIFFSGLGTGYIYCHSYDPKKLQTVLNQNKKTYEQSDYKGEVKLWTSVEVGSEDAKGEYDAPITLLWKTKRHKGSVRSLCLDTDGSFIFSVGTDNILKKAVADSGKVVKKTTLKAQKSKITKMIKSETHPYLLLGDEDGNVIIMNSDTLAVTNTIAKIHNSDAINDIFHFAKRSLHKFISLGQTTLAYWDSRESNESDFEIQEDDTEAKRKVLLSDDQEDELLCGTFVDPEVGDTIACGMGEGILTVWKPKKNDLEDQVNRVKICKDESIDCVVPSLQDDSCVWCGCSNGMIYKVDVKGGRVVEKRKHSSTDEVTFLDLDFEYRIASGGMDKLLIWELNGQETHDESSDIELSSSPSSDPDSSGDDSGISGEGSDSDENGIWEKLPDADHPSLNGSDVESESSESDNELDKKSGSKTFLSRSELIAELDRDIFGEDESEEEKSAKRNRENDNLTTKKLNAKKKKILAKQTQKAQNNSHGITKFDDL